MALSKIIKRVTAFLATGVTLIGMILVLVIALIGVPLRNIGWFLVGNHPLRYWWNEAITNTKAVFTSWWNAE